MEVRYALNAENFTDYNLYLTDTPEFHQRVKRQGLLAGAMVLAIGVVMLFVSPGQWRMTVAVSLLGALLIALLLPVIARGGTKLATINAIRSEGEAMFREQTLTVDGEELCITAEGEEQPVVQRFSKADVHAVTPYKSILLLEFANGNLLIVPLAALDEAAKAALLALVD